MNMLTFMRPTGFVTLYKVFPLIVQIIRTKCRCGVKVYYSLKTQLIFSLIERKRSFFLINIVLSQTQPMHFFNLTNSFYKYFNYNL